MQPFRIRRVPDSLTVDDFLSSFCSRLLFTDDVSGTLSDGWAIAMSVVWGDDRHASFAGLGLT